MDYSIYLVLAPLTGAVLLILLVLVWQRREKRSARNLALFIAGALGFLAANYLELVSKSLSLKVVWAEIEHVWADLLPVAWLLFVVDFTELAEWKLVRRFWPLAIPPVADVVLTFTNRYHHLIWRTITFVPVAHHVAMQVTHGGFFFAIQIIAYVMYLGGLFVLQRQLRGSFGIYRRQLILVSLGILIPMAFNIVYISRVIPGFRKDFTAIGFGFAAIVCVIAILNARFLEILPSSRNRVFNVLNDGIIVLDGRRRVVDVNKSAMVLLDLDDSIIGQTASSSREIAGLLGGWDGLAESFTRDVTIHRGGHEFYYEIHLLRNREESAKKAGVIIAIHDVTERVRLRRSEVLLKEIHHRVKNNLQVISSLLLLQEDRLPDPGSRAVLKECRNQVLSMALVHEDLYRSEDFDSIDFGTYIRNLSTRLLSVFHAEGRVTLELSLDDIVLDIERAIPCALITNELCTNVLKHAFPPSIGERPCVLSIELHEQNGMIRLIVADNGVGIDTKRSSGKSSSLGMQIVYTLAKQLHGDVRVESAGGTRVAITFGRQPPGVDESQQSERSKTVE